MNTRLNLIISGLILAAFLSYAGWSWQKERRLEAARSAVIAAEERTDQRLALALLDDDANPTGNRETRDMLAIFPQGTTHFVGEWTPGTVIPTTPGGRARVEYLGKRRRDGLTFALFRYLPD